MYKLFRLFLLESLAESNKKLRCGRSTRDALYQLKFFNPNIFVHIVDTHNNFSQFIKGIFCATCLAGFVGLWQIIALPAEIQRWLI